MQMNISGHHLEVTDALRSYVSTKIPRLERHFDQIGSVNVTLTLDHDYQHKAEANLHVKGSDLFAHAAEDNMYKAIDLLVDRLDRQLRKHKEKLVSRKHAG